ncbi:hypothetical protein [Variovorax sp. LT1R16]|uniref:hypothetical protein n=1 Tax=Variovorax sp. LT1R16 TaxID=3443728 RepID=UPI003F44C571
MKKRAPNPLRCLIPALFGVVPLIGAMLWYHLMSIVHSMAKLPNPELSTVIGYLVAISAVVGMFISLYRTWADYVRGDYYFDLAESRGW